jgi:multidrug efflux pump subunit AcrB
VIVTVCCVATVAGAVYSPAVEIVPVPAGLMDHVTAVLLVFVTVAENCCVWLAYKLAVVGVRLTAIGGIKVTVAEAAEVPFCWLVAVTVTGCFVVMLAGAVYSPVALMLPVPAGLIDHVTAVLLLFVTVAENCCVWPP